MPTASSEHLQVERWSASDLPMRPRPSSRMAPDALKQVGFQPLEHGRLGAEVKRSVALAGRDRALAQGALGPATRTGRADDEDRRPWPRGDSGYEAGRPRLVWSRRPPYRRPSRASRSVPRRPWRPSRPSPAQRRWGAADVGAPLQPFQVPGTSAATTAARAPPTVALDKAIRARGRPGVSRTGVSDLTSKRNYPGSGECRK